MPPTLLIPTLTRVQKRVQRLTILYGLARWIVALVGLFTAIVGLDYLLNLPAAPRIVLITAAITLLAWLAHQWIAEPIRRRMSLIKLASRIETAFPQFEDRLSSSVHFLSHDHTLRTGLQDYVIAETADMAGRIDLHRAIDPRPARRWGLAAAGSLAAIAILAVLVGTGNLGIIASRIFTPLDGKPWPKSVEIQLLSQIPPRGVAGQKIDVRLRLTRGDRASRQAEIFLQLDNSSVQEFAMTRDATGNYIGQVTLPTDAAAGSTVKLWTAAGDDETPPAQIDVVAPLSITTAQLLIEPPSYTGEKPTTLTLDAAPQTVVYGSNLTLKLTFNKPLDVQQNPSVEPIVGNDSPPPAITWNAHAGSQITGGWIARSTVSFCIQATGADGLIALDSAQYQIAVRADASPKIEITLPGRTIQCTARALIPLRAVAEDDFKITDSELLADRLGEGASKFSPIPLIAAGSAAAGSTVTALDSTGEIRRWQIDQPWDLTHLSGPPLKPGETIEYYASATDNFNFEGKHHDPATSGRYRLSIISDEQFAAAVAAQLGQTQQQINQLQQDQQNIQHETADLQLQTHAKSKLSAADRAIADQLAARQATAAQQARQTARQLDDLLAELAQNREDPANAAEIAAAVRDGLNQTAEQPMKDAALRLSSLDQTAANRDASLQQTGQDQSAAQQQLSSLSAKLGEQAGLSRSVQQVQQLLSDQQELSRQADALALQNLGKQHSEMSPADQQKADQQTADQKKLADAVDKAVQQISAGAEKENAHDPDAAAAMRQAAADAQQQDVSGEMRQAADAMTADQSSIAQQARSQAEVGLQTVLHELQAAERTQLQTLERKLADLRTQVRELLRQQSSLNYDNLLTRGPDTLKTIDPKEIASLLAAAQWTAGQTPPAPPLETQTRLQEQTERNTRSVAGGAQSVDGGGSSAGSLLLAASRMDRAIAELRNGDGDDNQRLTAAYDPPQTEAVAALRTAEQAVQKQLAQAQEKLDNQQRDSIRQAYEKILAAQKKLDADTQGIEKTRDATGELPRRSALRLRQLPPEQKAIIDSAHKLDSDLEALGGVVYTWANQDLAAAMQKVQAELDKSQTDATVQAQQSAIEQQIQAMIDSLSVDPSQSPFVQKNEGGGKGGGQSGSPPLPPEAELRLLKRLQLSVNQQTTALGQSAADPSNKQAAADSAQLLGERQGVLRHELDHLLQNASKGKMKIGPEPDPSEKLPEEATDETLDNDELQQSLLGDSGQPAATKEQNDVALIGQRMGRSRQRLALDHDPGKTTQAIQKRILANMDQLIAMARQQQAQAQSQNDNSSSGQAQNPNPNQQQSGSSQQNQGTLNSGNSPAMAGRSHDVNTQQTPNGPIAQSMKEWGATSPRTRAAVIQAATEKPVEKFKKFVDEYYRALGERAADAQGSGDSSNNGSSNGSAGASGDGANGGR